MARFGTYNPSKVSFNNRELYYDKNATGLRRWADETNWSNIASGERIQMYSGESIKYILQDIGWVSKDGIETSAQCAEVFSFLQKLLFLYNLKNIFYKKIG